MGRHLHKNQHHTQGFTIVELAVVIAVVGILAAITVVGYGAWRTSIAAGEVKNDLNGVAAGMESARSWNESGYPEYADNTVFSSTAGTDDIFDGSDSVTLTYRWGNATSFCIEAVSVARSSVVYHYTISNGVKTTAEGVCPVDNTGTVSTIVSGGLNYPTGIAVDSSHNLYVAETGNHRILKITQAGVVTVLAGGTQGYLNGSGTGARFNTPYGVALATNGDLYVVDYGNQRIRRVTQAGAVSTVAGSTQGSTNANGESAQFWNPYAIAFESATGSAYITETGNHRVRKLAANGDVTTLAGSSTGYVNDTGTAARFADPIGVAVHADGNIYVVENGNDKVRKVTTAGVVTLVAGSSPGYANGTGSSAQFNNPTGIGIRGNIAYIADSVNNRVRTVNVATGVVETLAGSGASGGGNGQGTGAEFNNPTGIAVGTNGVVYIVETNAGRIRKIE